MRADLRGDLFVLAGALLWSSGGVCIKALDGLNPWAISAGRSGLCALVLLAMLRGRVAPRRCDLGAAALGSVVFACVVTTFVIANRLTTAANAILLQYTAPIWVALHTWAADQRRPTGREIAALVLGASGVLLCVREGLTVFRESGTAPLALMGDTLALLSGIFFAALIVILRRFGQATRTRKDDPPLSLLVLFHGNILAALAGFPALATGLGGAWVTGHDPLLGWLILLWLGVGQLGGGYWFFQRGVRTTAALTASLLCLIEPVLNPVWVALAVGEVPDSGTLAGGALVLASVTLALVGRGRTVGAASQSVDVVPLDGAPPI